MITKILTCFFLLMLFIPNCYTQTSETKETFLEETLIWHYSTYFSELSNGKAYFCSKIRSINRINNSSNQHEVVAQFVTFEGAHNPPYDLYIVKFHETPAYVPKVAYKIKTISVDLTKNASDFKCR